MKTRGVLAGLALKKLAVSGLALTVLTANAAAAPAPQLQVDQVAITGGRLVITGRPPVIAT